MGGFSVDIIIPVWNRPVETRDCLVSLIEHSPGARIIMVDNGSDRETERILQEFAEGLGERALLLRNEANEGFVRAANRGLARGEAPFLAIVRNTSQVTAGWLESLLCLAREREEAGLAVPRLVQWGTKDSPDRMRNTAPCVEAALGSFAAMLLKKRVYDTIGGFDEEMDGGEWCLKEYSRRAYRAGFLTFAADGGSVFFREERPLGSLKRREERLERTVAGFVARWGEGRSFCLYFPKSAEFAAIAQKLPVLMQGARQGDRFHLLLSKKAYRLLLKDQEIQRHENITYGVLPLWGAAKVFSRLSLEEPGIRAVDGIDGVSFPGVGGSMPFAELERAIAAMDKYR